MSNSAPCLVIKGENISFCKLLLPYDPAVPLLGTISKENINTNSKKIYLPNVHSSIIYNSPDMEMT